MNIKRIWNLALQYIESGDLILPVVLVSAAHYGVALTGKDFWIIAFVIGVLVDLGHYRTVKAAIKYSRERIDARWWIAALVMTGLAFGFHFAFYNDKGDWRELLFSIAIPLVIVILAALSVKENWAGKAAKGIAIPATSPQVATNGTDAAVPLARKLTFGNTMAMSVSEMVDAGVPQRTAYRWSAKRIESQIE